MLYNDDFRQDGFGYGDGIDININNTISIPIMYVIVGISTLLLITTYILQNKFSKIR